MASKAKKYPILSVLKQDGSIASKAAEPDLKDAEIQRIYETMLRTRMLNERGMNLQRQGRINFFIGSEGQEAVPTGAAAALRPDDPFFPHYRDPAVALYRGASLAAMVHQCYGTGKDLVKGRQMPNHYSFKEQEFFSISSPLTTQVPQATGAAYAIKVKGEDRVVVTSFGDGSTSEGDFHVGLNFAGVWDAPIVFLCNNNHWAISVPVEKQTRSETFAQKAEAYGFEGRRVDGNDVFAVYQAMKEAAEHARSGKGPLLVEAVTYRMGPHSSSDDPKRYVDPQTLKEWEKRDAVARLRKYMEKNGIWDDKKDAALVESIKDEIQKAVEEVEATEELDLITMFEDVYAEMPWHLRKQYEELKEV